LNSIYLFNAARKWKINNSTPYRTIVAMNKIYDNQEAFYQRKQTQIYKRI